MFLKHKKQNLNTRKLRFQNRNFPYPNTLYTSKEPIVKIQYLTLYKL